MNIRSSLTHFLGYLHKNGITADDLSEHVPRVHYYARAKLDKVWSDEEIERMLNSIDRANSVGKRDYAIMAIAANLGLRTSDIVSLKIEDFNWNQGTINIVQQKTKEPLSLPIPSVSLQTKGDSISFQTPSIEGTIVRRNKPLGNDKHPWKAEVTEGDSGVADSTITNWFKAVYEPTYAGD